MTTLADGSAVGLETTTSGGAKSAVGVTGCPCSRLLGHLNFFLSCSCFFAEGHQASETAKEEFFGVKS